MSEKNTKEVSLSIPTKVEEGGLPDKIYVPFTEQTHKQTLIDTFPNYERTAIAKELAEFWMPQVIREFQRAIKEGQTKITFNLSK